MALIALCVMGAKYSASVACARNLQGSCFLFLWFVVLNVATGANDGQGVAGGVMCCALSLMEG